MKVLIHILVPLVLFLSVNPCCGEDSDTNKIEATACDSHDHEEGHHEDSPCSPFLTCGNCIGFQISSLVAKLPEAPAVESPTFYIFYQEIDQQDFLPFLLRPPRLV